MFETQNAGNACPPSYDALTLTLTRPAFLTELGVQAQLAQRSGNVFSLLLARRRSPPKHQRLPRHRGRRRRAERLDRSLPPRDRRAGVASIGVHVRPLRRRRADGARAAVRLESGRDARRGAALRRRREARSAIASAPRCRSASRRSASASPSTSCSRARSARCTSRSSSAATASRLRASPPSRVERAKVVGLF